MERLPQQSRNWSDLAPHYRWLIGSVIGIVVIALVGMVVVVARGEQSVTAVSPHVATGTPTLDNLGPIPVSLLNTRIQTGMVFPRYGAPAYSDADGVWTGGLKEIKKETGANWVSMPLFLNVPSLTTPQVVTLNDKAASVESMRQGIRTAHKMRLSIYIAPLLSVSTGEWIGYLKYTAPDLYSKWFDSYWNVLKPYVLMAQQERVEQFSIGSEFQAMETDAPASVWTSFIDKIRSVYNGRLVYTTNHESLTPTSTIPDWMKYHELDYIGVSLYMQLFDTAARPDLASLAFSWAVTIRPLIDQFAAKVGKSVMISEIGYRNATDTLYQPWLNKTSAAPDPALQAAAYNAAFMSLLTDNNVAGVYVWGWYVPVFDTHSRPAAGIIRAWYSVLRDAAYAP